MTARPLALVVQRYGEEIVGGSEALCRTVAEMLVRDGPVEVLTSCARDYVTWKNELPAGLSTLNGVTVRRFPTDFERGPHWHQLMSSVLGGSTLDAYRSNKAAMRAVIARSGTGLQLECLKQQGPYSTPLLEHLAAHRQEYTRVLFFTYLYPTTFFGMQQVAPAQRILIPTAHDEAPIFFPVFREMFAGTPAFIFLTPEERRFVEDTFDIGSALRRTVGMPVGLPGVPDPARFRSKYGIAGPFLLYAGRVDPAKGCDTLFHFFRVARRHLPADLQLIVIGSRAMDLPSDPRLRYLGFLPDQDKADAMSAALAVVNPSPFESFSIVALEAMLCGRPVLVTGQCAVLRGHVVRGRSGLYYRSYEEFVEAVRLLAGDEALCRRLGANGAEYVSQNYQGEIVRRRYKAFLSELDRRDGGA